MAEPQQATISGAPLGYNCRMSVGGYGSHLARAVRLAYGVNILSREGESKNRRTFYPWITTSSSFKMVLIFDSYSQREAFNKWVSGYWQKLVNNEAVNGYMRVQVPARRFDRLAIPTGTLEYGDSVGRITYPTSMSFKGSSDPISALGKSDVAGASTFQQSAAQRDVTQHFYPLGSQKSGAESLEGTIFDPTPTPTNLDWSTPTGEDRREEQRRRAAGLPF